MTLSAWQNTPQIIQSHDKFAHFIVFFILSFSMTLSHPNISSIKIIFLMLFLAFGIELFQHLFADERFFSFVDLGAGFLGIILFFMIHKIIAKKQNLKNYV